MRQMTKKRKNSPESDGEPSDENGVASNARASDSGSDDSASEKSDKNTKTRRTSIKKRSSRSRGKQEDPVDETPEIEEQEKPAGSEQENGQKGGSKRRKKDEKPAATAPSQNEENEDDEYEVEKVVAQRTIKGRRQFLVRWKGYGEDADTWEQEKDLNCPQLIEEFLAEQADEETTEKTPKSTKSKSTKKTSKKAKKDEGTKNDEENDNEEDEDKEFEVERIIEVHFAKNKKRLFLIRWKGFSQTDDSWEPEENLNCPDLIAKFMEKVESAKKTDRRELRANPALTKPCTLGTHGRRHSRRNVDKQRVTYQGCE